MIKECVVGTRGSALALIQAHEALSRLREAFPGAAFHLRIAASHEEDPHRESRPGKGLFVKALQDLLIRGEIDIAVHSLKDLPANLESTEIAVFLPREDPRDALVSRNGKSLDELPPGAVIGTSSLRRRMQLMLYRRDLVISPLRGNVDTRLTKTISGEVDALILAAAGLIRLGRGDRITQYLPPDHFVPSAGQGVIALEVRKGDRSLGPALAALDHLPTRMEALTELTFLKQIHADCSAPVGAHATIRGTTLSLRTMYAPPGEEEIVSGEIHGPSTEGERMARILAFETLGRPREGGGVLELGSDFTWRIRRWKNPWTEEERSTWWARGRETPSSSP